MIQSDTASQMGACKSGHKNPEFRVCLLCNQLLCKLSVDKHMVTAHPQVMSKDVGSSIDKIVDNTKKRVEDRICPE